MYLSFKKGGLLYLRPGLEDGWAYGSNAQGVEGFLPPSYTQEEVD